jgi:formyl-CoA transferase
VLIAGNGDGIYRRLMHAIDRNDLGSDTRLQNNSGRVSRADEIDRAIDEWTRQRTVDDVLAAMEQARVPAGRIYTVADIARDPHYAARGMVLRQETFDGLNLAVPGVVPKLSATPGVVRERAPRLGEHTEVVVRRLGLSDQQIEQLRRRGVIQ